MKSKKGQKRKKVYRQVHRLLGFFLLVPLLFFTISGVLLMHKSDLGIDEKRVKSEWVMGQYGLHFEGEPRAWRAAEDVVAQWEGQCVLGDTAVEVNGEVVAAVAVKNGLCVATDSAVYFFGIDRKLVELLEVGLSLPGGGLRRLGLSGDGRLVVETSESVVRFVDDDLLAFNEIESSDTVKWSESVVLDSAEKSRLKQAIIGEGVPMDRVILDFHSGHIFKLLGKVLVDAFAIGILGLCFSGVGIYMRKRRRERKEA